MDFTGRVVAVTGAGSGFGRAIVRGFAARGAKVHGCDLTQESLAALSDVAGFSSTAFDLRDRAAAARWIAEIEHREGAAIDILVNNAGGSLALPFTPIEDVRDEDWDRLFAVNIHGTFATCRAVARGMKKAGRGAIVTISSGAGLKPSLTGLQGYCSAKHAVVGFTRQLAAELGPFGIRVNSVAPGLVMTDPDKERRWQGYTEEKRNAKLSALALRRLGTAEEIANGVFFLASDLAGYVTGQVLSVDGGSF
jgi:3-oxoacyl-[acyl-carrier protein] reductase